MQTAGAGFVLLSPHKNQRMKFCLVIHFVCASLMFTPLLYIHMACAYNVLFGKTVQYRVLRHHNDKIVQGLRIIIFAGCPL